MEIVMAESLLSRVRRIIAGGAEDLTSTLERAGGVGVMRQAIREVDQVIDEVRTALDAATARRLQSTRQRRMFEDQITATREKARFALAEGREDLAEAALSRAYDLAVAGEGQEQARADATQEESRLEACAAALAARKTRMVDELAAFESARRDASARDGMAAVPHRSRARTVEHAEAAFDRAMAAAGGVTSGGRAAQDADTDAKLGEITALQRRAAIAQMMNTLRATHQEA
jgi:phage shock protein A